MEEKVPTIEDQLNYLSICDRAIEYYNGLAQRFEPNLAQKFEDNAMETSKAQIAQANAKYYATLKENMLLVLLQNVEFRNYADQFNVPNEANKQDTEWTHIL